MGLVKNDRLVELNKANKLIDDSINKIENATDMVKNKASEEAQKKEIKQAQKKVDEAINKLNKAGDKESQKKIEEAMNNLNDYLKNAEQEDKMKKAAEDLKKINKELKEKEEKLKVADQKSTLSLLELTEKIKKTSEEIKEANIGQKNRKFKNYMFLASTNGAGPLARDYNQYASIFEQMPENTKYTGKFKKVNVKDLIRSAFVDGEMRFVDNFDFISRIKTLKPAKSIEGIPGKTFSKLRCVTETFTNDGEFTDWYGNLIQTAFNAYGEEEYWGRKASNALLAHIGFECMVGRRTGYGAELISPLKSWVCSSQAAFLGILAACNGNFEEAMRVTRQMQESGTENFSVQTMWQNSTPVDSPENVNIGDFVFVNEGSQEHMLTVASKVKDKNEYIYFCYDTGSKNGWTVVKEKSVFFRGETKDGRIYTNYNFPNYSQWRLRHVYMDPEEDQFFTLQTNKKYTIRNSTPWYEHVLEFINNN
ncbi:MAG: hypothetical protein IKP28_01625 [Clostridia bacterium]|nr:hypothetical protein [Clostridia bacterium]